MTETHTDTRDGAGTADTRGTIAQFIRETGVRMGVEWICERPDRGKQTDKDREWDRQASHYRCTLRRARKSLRVYFSQGAAHTDEPTLASVLDCLVSDVTSVINANGFEDWCAEMGSDPDSRRAERCYRQIDAQHRGLARLFTADELDRLYWKTERL